MTRSDWLVIYCRWHRLSDEVHCGWERSRVLADKWLFDCGGMEMVKLDPHQTLPPGQLEAVWVVSDDMAGPGLSTERHLKDAAYWTDSMLRLMAAINWLDWLHLSYLPGVDIPRVRWEQWVNKTRLWSVLGEKRSSLCFGSQPSFVSCTPHPLVINHSARRVWYQLIYNPSEPCPTCNGGVTCPFPSRIWWPLPRLDTISCVPNPTQSPSLVVCHPPPPPLTRSSFSSPSRLPPVLDPPPLTILIPSLPHHSYQARMCYRSWTQRWSMLSWFGAWLLVVFPCRRLNIFPIFSCRRPGTGLGKHHINT